MGFFQVKYWVLYCDNCGLVLEEEVSKPKREAVKELIEAAIGKYDWVYENGKWYCDECWEELK